jgi:copper chaperone NosL
LILLLLFAACSRQIAPAALDTANTTCSSCRMAVSDASFAAQIVAPGAEPLFFDDLACLRNYVEAQRAALAADAVAFVADHRTREWIRAADAYFVRTSRVSTPMGGGVIAFTDARSMEQDEAARGGEPLSVSQVFGAGGVPSGQR